LGADTFGASDVVFGNSNPIGALLIVYLPHDVCGSV
jgi:hypothetical protein